MKNKKCCICGKDNAILHNGKYYCRRHYDIEYIKDKKSSRVDKNELITDKGLPPLSRGYKSTNRFYEFDSENVVAITTNNGDIFIADLEDKEKIDTRSWRSISDYPITSVSLNGSHYNIGMHRVIMNPSSDEHIDHINRNRKDNRKCNLRMCDMSENNRNKFSGKDNKGLPQGVHSITVKSGNKSYNYYEARLMIRGKLFQKVYKTEEQAVAQRKEWEEEYFGEFSRDNSEIISDNTVYNNICNKINNAICPIEFIDKSKL